jgi:hypothetical protein
MTQHVTGVLKELASPAGRGQPIPNAAAAQD